MKLKSILLLSVFTLGAQWSTAQSWLEDGPTIRNNHFYYHVDLNWGNIYPAAISSVITGFINYVAKDAVIENGFMYDFNRGKQGDETIKTRSFSPMGLNARDLFNSLKSGVRLGYKSVNRSSFNWGIYASAHYKLNQFEMRLPGQEDYVRQRLQYVQAGGGLLFIIGGLDKPSRVTIEAGCAYSLPIGYSGDHRDKGALNKGITSHFAVKLGGKSYLQNIGLFADINHFNTFDKNFTIGGGKPYENNTLRSFCVGLQLSVTFMQAGRRD